MSVDVCIAYSSSWSSILSLDEAGRPIKPRQVVFVTGVGWHIRGLNT
jgi:hypothetical protein